MDHRSKSVLAFGRPAVQEALSDLSRRAILERQKLCEGTKWGEQGTWAEDLLGIDFMLTCLLFFVLVMPTILAKKEQVLPRSGALRICMRKPPGRLDPGGLPISAQAAPM